MKLLIMTGPLFPQPGNNANLIGKLIPHLLAAGQEVHLFSAAFGSDEKMLPSDYLGVPVHWAMDQKQDWRRRLLYPAVSKLIDPHGFSDALQVQILLGELKTVRRVFSFDAVLSTSEPFTMACTAAQLSDVRKVLYVMDPPACVSNGRETVFRNRILPSILKSQDVLITTPFIMDALKEQGFPIPKKAETVGFPLITSSRVDGQKHETGKIRLLYCGWLYSDIRSPKYFLDILSRLDERFEVTFMGKECEKLQERFTIKTKAKIIAMPQQPYEAALQAMADADILINIGNSVPVHMPSKTLEYINTGKPMVNFYKLAECPTLFYTKRYPLALNIYEGNGNIEAATARFVRFCEENIGKALDRVFVSNNYRECTPKYIAEQICRLTD